MNQISPATIAQALLVHLPQDIYNYLSPRQHVTYYFDPQQTTGA